VAGVRGALITGVIVGCAVTWCADPSLGHSIATPACGPAGAHTIAVDAVARVYSENQTVYGCALPGGLSVTLKGGSGVQAPRISVGPVALAGTIAAFGLSDQGVDTRSATVIVTQLRGGRRLSNFPALTALLGVEAHMFVRSIVAGGDGGVAWIASGTSPYVATVTQVFRGHRTHKKLLDHSPDSVIAPRSLHLHGSRLTWKHGGQVRHAMLR
jgi:hypothetical protein